MTYFTTMVRLPMNRHLEWYIEECEDNDPLRYVHEKFGLVFTTREECKADIDAKIAKKGGKFLESLPERGMHNKLRSEV